MFSWFKSKKTKEDGPAHAAIGSGAALSGAEAGPWENFFELAQIHESLRSSFKSAVGSWPSGVDPAIFGGSAGEQLIHKLHAFVTGPYPMVSLKDAYPEYRAVNGRVARASSQFVDMMICSVIPRDRISGKEPPAAIWSLIEGYSKLPLAKLLFTLPQVHLISATKEGKATLLVVKDNDVELYRQLDTNQILQIQVYKGVENTIFGAYDDLPEGGYLSDDAIEKKIRSLLPSSQS